MKTKLGFAQKLVMVLVLVACNTNTKEKAEYEIASPVYIALAQKSIDDLTTFYDSAKIQKL